MTKGLITAWKRDGFYFVKYDDAMSAIYDFHDARNIYRLPVDAEGRRAGAPVQLTVGASREAWPAVSRQGRMVFASGSAHVNVWSLPLDANAGKIIGAPYRVSGSLAQQAHPIPSPDERKLSSTIFAFY